MPSSDGGSDPEDYSSPIEHLKQMLDAERARTTRLAMKRREALLLELANIEDEYGLPRTKPARHKDF